MTSLRLSILLLFSLSYASAFTPIFIGKSAVDATVTASASRSIRVSKDSFGSYSPNSSKLFMIAATFDDVDTRTDAFQRLKDDGMSQDVWRVLRANADELTVPRGELILQEAEAKKRSKQRVSFILQGSAQLEVKGRIVATLEQGEFLGESSYLSGSKSARSASVRAKEDIRLMSWRYERLDELMSENPEVALRLKAVLGANVARKLSKTMLQIDVGLLEGASLSDASRAKDYGFRREPDAAELLAKATPVNGVVLASWSFKREWTALRRSYRFEGLGGRNNWLRQSIARNDEWLEGVFPILFPKLTADTPQLEVEALELQRKLKQLTLSNDAISQREKVRRDKAAKMVKSMSSSGLVAAINIKRTQTPWFVLLPYTVLCGFLDFAYDQRPLERFYFLETVARMPYFSFLSMLHLYETLGWWSIGSDARKVHFAEEWSEMNHLRIIESLGGDCAWIDRFLARHAAIIYYWILNIMFSVSPFLAYNFSELIESHAVDTYSQFLEENGDLLRSLPASPQAMNYYASGDMYMFDEFQASSPAYSRRPIINNLYDVFRNMMLDELEHVKTMYAAERSSTVIMSPNQAAADAIWAYGSDDEIERPLVNNPTVKELFKAMQKEMKEYETDYATILGFDDEKAAGDLFESKVADDMF